MKNNKKNFLPEKVTLNANSFLLTVMILLICFTGVKADQIATTDNGRKVRLEDSGMWSFADSATVASDSIIQNVAANNEKRLPGQNSVQQTTVPPVETQMDKSIIQIAVAVIAFLVLIIAGVVAYFTILQPAKKRKKLMKALVIVQHEQEERYNEVEKMLSEVVSSGLKSNDLKEGYFARAFVRAKIGNYSGCASDLESADRKDPCVIYLDLWAHLKLEKYKRAFELYEEHEPLLVNHPDAKKMMSVACFQIGKEHWDKREIKESVPYFNHIRKLGVFADKVPDSISDHEITLGILELLDGRNDEASKHFEGAIQHAKENNDSPVHGQIGKLLCRWRDGGQALLDKDLASLINDLEEVTEAGNNNPESEDDNPMSSEVLLLRNMLLLHGVSLLHYWIATHDKNNLLQKTDRDEIQTRLGKVIERDERMPDPKLILGLIDYWFFNNAHKSDALNMLEDSQTTIPEVMRLIAKEKANEELEHKKLDTFLAIVREYLNNKEISQKMKEALMKRLEQFSKFKEKGISIDQEKYDAEGVTIEGLQNRQAIMRKKMDRIVKGIFSENKEKAEMLNTLMTEITEASNSIQKHAEKLEKTEQELLVNTGEFLLRDEEESGIYQIPELVSSKMNFNPKIKLPKNK